MKWRLVKTRSNNAAVNMAIDEAIMLSYSRGVVPPTLRLFSWKPAAVSLGYFQRAKSEIDLEACGRLGIDVVRRLTGGRAVLHDDELTYSIVVSEKYPGVPPTISASYRYFSQGLILGLERMGIDVKMSMPLGAYGQTVPRRRPSSAACFDAPSHYEITCEGRKLVGSAQVRKAGVILQHGSILINFSPETLAGVLRVSSPEEREFMAEVLAHTAVSLEEILGKSADREKLCDVVAGAFAEALGVEFQEQGLTAEEVEVSGQLAREKYSQPGWNMLR